MQPGVLWVQQVAIAYFAKLLQELRFNQVFLKLIQANELLHIICRSRSDLTRFK